jgi:hypothetical protein
MNLKGRWSPRNHVPKDTITALHSENESRSGKKKIQGREQSQVSSEGQWYQYTPKRAKIKPEAVQYVCNDAITKRIYVQFVQKSRTSSSSSSSLCDNSFESYSIFPFR